MGESVEKPLEYFDNNVAGTVTLLHAMWAAAGRRDFLRVFGGDYRPDP